MITISGQNEFWTIAEKATGNLTHY